MKLYNVYRICKQNIDFEEKIDILSNQTNTSYTVNNWIDLKNIVEKIRKIPALYEYADNFIQTIPDTVRHKNCFKIDRDTYNSILSNKNILHDKMYTIIELYESMGLNDEDNSNAIDIKLPACEDLDGYISYLKDLNFIFSQCPFLQCEGELLKFGSVDVGSNWLRLTIAATSVSVILTNTASLLDKALALRSHYITIQQQEEMLKSAQLKNELAEEQLEMFRQLKDAGIEIVIRRLEKDHEMQLDPEERDKTERSLDKLILFLDKGGEIYASLESPENIQLLFPEIQGNLELPENIIKYLEDKENSENQQ